jgi:5-methylcytosine-specific restriction endonuclease McrA
LHFGSGPPYFSSEDGYGSLTSKRKVCGAERELVEWAIKSGITIKRCQDCVRDGLVDSNNVANDLEAHVLEAKAGIMDAGIRQGSLPLAADATPAPPPEALPEELSEGSYLEGQGVQIVVNRYERDAPARAACLNHFGYLCQICKVDLSTVYGPIAAGLVHVHHLRPLSQIAGEYEVRPEQDLIPVCPNCHAVVHRHDPPLTPDEVREMISQTGTGEA